MASPARRPLAILGASPTFQTPLHVGRPNIGDRDRFLATLAQTFDDRWFTNDGPLVRAFEAAIATEVGARRCVALANGTLGLQLLVRALALSGEVIVPSFTFISTATALSWEGLTPVFCDVDPQTHMIDANHAESLLSERTSAILGVHLWGGLCDSGALEALAQRSGVPLIFDGAHALGAKREGCGPGSFGQATMLSFHATKIVNAFEGGAIVTDDEELADRLALMRNFGFTGPDSVVTLGINAKMNEASAAMGLNTLADLQDTIVLNSDRHAHYRAAFDGFAHLRLIAEPPPQVASNHHYLVAEVSQAGPLNRDQLQAVLEAEGVLARRYFYPGCHRSAPYAGETRTAPLPATEALCDRILQFPTGPTVTHDDVAGIAEIVEAAFAQHGAVAGILEKKAT
ncbi:MAG: aminotransferase class I/II-fold pyridoxal phosphate-dependent enzyme [Kiloniellales bacterium]